jgi:CRP-like cAMP-binding protein
MSTHPIWQKLDDLFESQTWTNWLSPIQAIATDGVKLDELAKSAKTLADLYAGGKSKGPKNRAMGYGLLAAQAYVKMYRIAPAMAMCDWLRTLPDSQGVVEYLESEISRAVCNAPTGKVEDLGTETRVQDKDMIERLRESFRTEKTLPYPKAVYPFLSELPLNEVNALIQKARTRIVADQEVLFNEGDQPDSFYLVAEGCMELSSNAGFTKSFHEGEFFGELGVLGNMKRTASARSIGASTVIEFSKTLLVESFIQFPELEQKILRYFYLRLFLNKVRQDPLFKDMAEKDHLEFFYTFRPGLLRAGKPLFQTGDFSDSFYYLLAGEWEVQRPDGSKIIQGPGSFVGERGFLHKRPRNASVTAKTDCHYLQCQEGMFRNFGRNFPTIEELLHRLADERRDPAQTDPAMFIG